MSPPKDGDGIDGKFAALLTAEIAGKPVSDDGDEKRDLFHFTNEQQRKLLNLLDVVDDLEKFSKEDKESLAVLIVDGPELHAMAESRRFSRRVAAKLKWFGVQIAAFVAFLAAANELYMKLRGRAP